MFITWFYVSYDDLINIPFIVIKYNFDDLDSFTQLLLRLNFIASQLCACLTNLQFQFVETLTILFTIWISIWNYPNRIRTTINLNSITRENERMRLIEINRPRNWYEWKNWKIKTEIQARLVLYYLLFYSQSFE